MQSLALILPRVHARGKMSALRQLEIAQVHLRPGHCIIVEPHWRQKGVKVLPLGAALPAKVVSPAHLQAHRKRAQTWITLLQQ